jgi:hypothetical protein
MAAKFSGPGFVRRGATTLLKATSIDFSFESGNTDVDTLLEERAGHSAGPKKVTINIDEAIPTAGLEVDWVAVSASADEVDLDFVIAGRTYQCRGDVRDAKIGTGVGKPNTIAFNFHGKLLNPAA